MGLVYNGPEYSVFHPVRRKSITEPRHTKIRPNKRQRSSNNRQINRGQEIRQQKPANELPSINALLMLFLLAPRTGCRYLRCLLVRPRRRIGMRGPWPGTRRRRGRRWDQQGLVCECALWRRLRGGVLVGNLLHLELVSAWFGGLLLLFL